MTKVRRVDFSPDEWIAGTIALNLPERGLYITACALIYSHGGPIEVDHLKQACNDHGRTFNFALKRLLDLGKLVFDGTKLTNKRALNEIEKATKRVLNSRENGAKNNKTNALVDPLGVTINYQLPRKKDSVEILSTGAGAPSPTDPVKDLWDRGLAILGEGQRSLLGKMRKRYKDPAVLEAIVACEQEHPSDPPAFFVRCCEAKARDAPGNYHETPLGNLWKGAHRAAEAIIARQNQRNLGNRDAPAFPLLDGGRTRSDPPDAA